MTIATEICFKIAKTMVVKRDANLSQASATPDGYKRAIAGATPASFDQGDYSDWRKSELVQQFDDHFSTRDLADQRILDFGCGTGELSFHAARHGAKTVVGIDINEGGIIKAKRQAEQQALPVKPEFMNGDATSIPLEDGACDVILCFDVLEHVYHPREILTEWKRVLSEGGKILIWWQPYYHPYGHHLMAYLPIPWAHAVFSDKTLAAVCKRIFDMPEYVPRYWDLDGAKQKKDKQFGETYLGGVNKLTISEFERLCDSVGLEIKRREVHCFSGPWPVRNASGLMSRLPFFREFFTAYMIYEITKRS